MRFDRLTPISGIGCTPVKRYRCAITATTTDTITDEDNGYNNNTYNPAPQNYANNNAHNGYNGYNGYNNNTYNPAPQYYASNYAPQAGRTYVVQWGDTLRNIAYRTNVNLNDLEVANPQLWNPNWIFAGQVINLPNAPQYYTVQYGPDTLAIICIAFWHQPV